MSITYGFYNSSNGDRRYNALQMSSIFDGIINDGVFATIGGALTVSAKSGMTVEVSEGRAWFDHTWTLNDSSYMITIPESEVILNRIDTIVIDVNQNSRTNDIIVVKGTPASYPVAPALIKTPGHNQYPLCHIYVGAYVTAIEQADITNLVGTSECPFITGVLQTITTDALVAQWQNKWNRWFNTNTGTNECQWDEWFEETTKEINAQKDKNQASFETWFVNLQTVLDGNIATNLATKIIELQNKFNTLEKERCIYSDITDNDSDVILDSNGSAIISRAIF